MIGEPRYDLGMMRKEAVVATFEVLWGDKTAGVLSRVHSGTVCCRESTVAQCAVESPQWHRSADCCVLVCLS